MIVTQLEKFECKYLKDTVNALMRFGPYWAKGKLAWLSFYENGEQTLFFFVNNFISNGLIWLYGPIMLQSINTVIETVCISNID